LPVLHTWTSPLTSFSVCLPFRLQSQRTGSRSVQPPARYAEEQAAYQWQQQEQRDVNRAIRASMGSEGPDIAGESSDESPPSLDESSDDEEESKDSTWSGEVRDINVPAFSAVPGKQHEAQRAQSVLDYFQLFLPLSLLQQWTGFTNEYAKPRNDERDWRTTPQELYAFIGVHIFMGICDLPDYHMYWSHEYGHSFVSSTFSRERFHELLYYFHVAPIQPPLSASDRLYHVRPLIKSLQESFHRQYQPSRYLTLDESIVAFKGRSAIKQYIPSKPHKWGYKVYCLASDDYLLSFEVYEGKQNQSSEYGSTYDLMLHMTEPYQYQQYILFTDNWFTSPTVANALLQRGIRLCGSVKSNRIGMPSISDVDINALGRGERIHKQKDDLTVDVWKDRRPLRVLYNHVSPLKTASLDRWDENRHRIAISCPQAVYDYFYHARSVDVINQLHYSYLVGRKSKKWWSRLVWWLIDMSIVNAFILWKIGKDDVNQLQFREQLMRSLVQWFLSNREPPQGRGDSHSKIYLASEHYFDHAPALGDCVQCSKRPDNRARATYVCHTCQVHLCIGKCFAQYHS
jgi:Transposase IS4